MQPFDDAPGLSSGLTSGLEPELSGLRHNMAPLIVHVDDDADLLSLVRHVLEQIGGFRVRSFRQGQAALAYVRHNRPAVLITDLVRPGLDGFGLVRAIRQDAALLDLPLLVFTAGSSKEYATAFGAAYLSKPCHWHDIIDQVHALINEDK